MSVGKRVSLKRFTKSQNRINVPDVGRHLIPDLWNADRKGMLPELGPYLQLL